MQTDPLRAGIVLCLCVAASTAVAAPDPEAGTAAAQPLVFAVYEDFAPFAGGGEGIDADLAKALAAKLGVPVEVREYAAGDEVGDDLRNIIWKGHQLWRRSVSDPRLADVMMHVPVDQALARSNAQVRILAPYFQERIVVARDTTRVPLLPGLDVFAREKIGVEAETLEDRYLMNAFGGLLRDHVVHFKSVADAAAALSRGEIAAVMGLESVVQAVLGNAAGRFEIAPPPAPGLAVTGWDLGLAVKADRPELVTALEHAMIDLLADGTVGRIFARRGVTHRPPSAGSAGR